MTMFTVQKLMLNLALLLQPLATLYSKMLPLAHMHIMLQKTIIAVQILVPILWMTTKSGTLA